MSGDADNNLLVRLHRWVVRQGENFTTEALVHLLRHLLRHQPEAALRLLARLSGERMVLSPDRANEVELKTQGTTEGGRPDVQMRTREHLIVIEVKVESGLGWKQLGRYRKELQKSGAPITCLVLLTRHPMQREDCDEPPDVFVRWHEVGAWFEQELSSGGVNDPVSRHLMEELIGFLAARGMVMERIGWELIPGLRAMVNLKAMMAEAATACEVRVQPTVGNEFSCCHLEGKKYWLGFYYTEPRYLYLSTNQVAIDVEKARKLSFGAVSDYKWGPSGFMWQDKLDLESEDVHFFARSRESQLRCLEQFIKRFLDAARTIEVASPDGGSAPEESSGEEPKEGAPAEGPPG
jgi:hypothetical protein